MPADRQPRPDDKHDDLDDVHFGSPDEPLPEWDIDDESGDDPDDEELDVTPPDVVAMLGFDPKELNDDPPADNDEAALAEQAAALANTDDPTPLQAAALEALASARSPEEAQAILRQGLKHHHPHDH
jgi:hypothetical protein